MQRYEELADFKNWEASFLEFLGKDAVSHAVGKCLIDLAFKVVMQIRQGETQASVQNVQVLLELIWTRLNIGKWDEIDVTWKYFYSHSSILHSLAKLRACREQPEQFEMDILRQCDLGSMLGAPVQDFLLNELASKLHSRIYATRKESKLGQNAGSKPCSKFIELLSSRPLTTIPDLSLHAVDKLVQPSFQEFRTYFNRKPVLISGTIGEWSALQKWRSLEYISQVCGLRTVPVEFGSKYTDSNWRQKLITIDDFVDQYLVPKCISVLIQRDSELREAASDNSCESRLACACRLIDHASNCQNQPVQLEEAGQMQTETAYLAQYQLFEQVSELRNDFDLPDYCCVRESDALATETDADADPDDSVTVNGWFGPVGTISPLHIDPKPNLLAQVVGYKYVLLLAPEEREALQVTDDALLSNSSLLDPENFDETSHPQFAQALQRGLQCVLQPGDMLHIPTGWWHFVKSLSLSFSVNFWWNA